MEAKPLYEAEAKKRQGQRTDLSDSNISQKVDESNQGKPRNDQRSDAQAAADFGTNRQYVTQAEKVKAQAIRVTK